MRQNRLLTQQPSIPLQLVLLVPFILQIFAVVGVTGYLSIRNGQKAISNVVVHLFDETSFRVSQQITTFLNKPAAVNQTIATAISEELIPIKDLQVLEHFYWRLLSQDVLDFTQTGTPQGTNVAVEHVRQGVSEARTGNLSDLPNRRIYVLNSQGMRSPTWKTLKYDPRLRPWYQAAIKAGKPVWGQLFVSTSSSRVSISLSQPIYSKAGNLLGVQTSNLRIPKMYDFLHNIKIGQTGQAFVMDRQGNLIASSVIPQPYIVKDKELKQISAETIDNPVIRAAAKALRQHFGNFSNITEKQQIDNIIDGHRQFIHVSPLQDQRGIDWLSVIVIPESDFTAEIEANTRTTILLCLAALFGATILGIYTSKWISQPILRLSQVSEAVANGVLDQTVEPFRIRELRILSYAFNRMIQQLRESFMTLEETNSQLEQRVEERTAELKKTLVTLEFSQSALVQAAEQAALANRAKSQFLANMSHELRTPLNGILGYAQLLQNDKICTSKQKKGITIIHQCGTHLLNLINDILDIAKIEAGKVELYLEDFHLPSFLQSLVEIFQLKAAEKAITFTYLPLNQLPHTVCADEKRLRQVLMNLLANAVKFTNTGRVTFKVEVVDNSQQLIINNQSINNSKIRFQIEDTGIGISSEHLPKIFLPFEQVGDNSRHAEGTGLGLAITQRIVECMGSKLFVESTLGVGSKFWFDLDLPVFCNLVESTLVTSNPISGYAGSPRKILIVDDYQENRTVLRDMLEPIGFKIEEAVDGQEGLQKAIESQPDLILVDLMMPIIDGYQMTQKLRQLAEFEHTVIIAVSAKVFVADRRESLEAGCNDFLPKPVSAEDLLTKIKRHLNLSWIYGSHATEPQKLEEESNHNSQILLEKMVVPPKFELIALYEAAYSGYVDDVIREAWRLQQLHPDYTPFVNQIMELANEFEYEKMTNLMDSYLSEDEN